MIVLSLEKLQGDIVPIFLEHYLEILFLVLRKTCLSRDFIPILVPQASSGKSCFLFQLTHIFAILAFFP